MHVEYSYYIQIKFYNITINYNKPCYNIYISKVTEQNRTYFIEYNLNKRRSSLHNKHKNYTHTQNEIHIKKGNDKMKYNENARVKTHTDKHTITITQYF